MSDEHRTFMVTSTFYRIHRGVFKSFSAAATSTYMLTALSKKIRIYYF